MARIVVKTEKGPFVLKPQAKPAFICMCGLSKNQPFCDQSHLKTTDEEDKLYEYDEKGKRHDLTGDDACCCGSCECDEKK